MTPTPASRSATFTFYMVVVVFSMIIFWALSRVLSIGVGAQLIVTGLGQLALGYFWGRSSEAGVKK